MDILYPTRVTKLVFSVLLFAVLSTFAKDVHTSTSGEPHLVPSTISGNKVTITPPQNNAINFDGNDDVISTGISNPGNSSFTLEMWVKPANVTGDVRIISSTAGLTNSASLRFNNGKLEIWAGGGGWLVLSSTAIPVNSWSHVAIVYNGTQVSGYVNGVLELTQNTSTVDFQTATLGEIYSGFGTHYSGSLDEFRFWNVVRTTAEIQASYATELTGSETGLIRYYNFNQGTADGTNTGVTSVFDGSSSSTNGALSNFALSGTSSNWVSGFPVPLSTDARLAGLTSSAGTLSPTFAAATTSYTSTVTNSVTSIKVTPTVAQADATVQVQVNSGGYSTVTSGNASSSLALNVGSNTIDVKVTAQDGSTTATYTLTITRSAPAVATITTTKSGPQKIGAVIPITITYTGDVTVASRTNLGIALNSGAVLADYTGPFPYTGTTLYFEYTIASGESTGNGYLDYGTTTSLIGGSIVDGNVNVDRTLPAPGTPGSLSDAKITIDNTKPTLSAVTISSNNSNTAFAKVGDKVTLAITADEDISTPTVTIAGQSATVTGSGSTFSAEYTMTNSQSEGTVAFNISFSDLAGNAGTAVTATTNSSSVTFDMTAPSAPTGLSATAGDSQVALSWSVNGESDLKSYKVYGGTSSNPTFLSATVTATTRTETGLNNGTTYYYRITAVDKAGNESSYSSNASATPKNSDAKLTALSLSVGTLSPTFAAAVTSYTASVSNSTSTITVSPTKSDAGASIEVQVNSGGYSSVSNGGPSSSLQLNVGSNTIDVKVTAEDGTTTKTYTISVTRAAAPAITSATYDANGGVLTVTGTNITNGGTIDVSKLTLTGEGGATYTLTTSNVTASSTTSFSVTLNATDKAVVNQMINKNGTSSTGATAYNLAASPDWMANVTGAADLTGNGITVSNVAIPAITSATYDANTGSLVVTGTGFLSKSGVTNDIVANKFTITGEGGATYTLTDTGNGEITSGTSFTLTLSSTDKALINKFINKNGTSSTGGTTYNLAAAEDWAAGADAAVTVVDATGNGITVSNVAVPVITSATYNANTGVLVVTGTGFLSASGATNDIVANKFEITGEGGSVITLTDTQNSEITSGTSFTLTLSSNDRANLNLFINKNGTSSTSGATYNLAAAEDWAAGADPAAVVADLTGNGLTASNVAVPAITSATYNANTGSLVVTGTGFILADGAVNDIVANKFTITGEGGATYTLTNTGNDEVTSGTSFSLTLSSTDKVAVNQIINKNGTVSTVAQLTILQRLKTGRQELILL